jgi:hypothetical protein
LKSTKTDKPVGNIGLSVGITGTETSKPFFQKKIKKLDSLTILSKTDKTSPDQFL